jgi:hypothetical protein
VLRYWSFDILQRANRGGDWRAGEREPHGGGVRHHSPLLQHWRLLPDDVLQPTHAHSGLWSHLGPGDDLAGDAPLPDQDGTGTVAGRVAVAPSTHRHHRHLLHVLLDGLPADPVGAHRRNVPGQNQRTAGWHHGLLCALATFRHRQVVSVFDRESGFRRFVLVLRQHRRDRLHDFVRHFARDQGPYAVRNRKPFQEKSNYSRVLQRLLSQMLKLIRKLKFVCDK